MYTLGRETAEIAGLFAGDGSMQEEHICFWGNPQTDKHYYDEVLKRLFRNGFSIEINPHYKKSNGVYGFYVCDKKVIRFFKNILGFAPGNKTYSLKIPERIFRAKNKEIWAAFIRGYFAADGCLNFHKRYGSYCDFKRKFHVYPRLFITSVSKQVLTETQELLSRLGINSRIQFKVSKNPDWQNSYALVVKGEKRLAKWAKIIGLNNLRDKTKLQVFMRFRFMPPNTTLDQRTKILNNELDITSFYAP